MISTFRTLCTLAIAHGYYGNGCRDFDFIVPSDTARLLRNGKLIAKRLDGRLNLLFEADENGAALIPLAKTRLRFGLKLLNPLFNNFTEFAGPTPLYRNSVVPESLDPPIGIVMTGHLLSHSISKTIRPVTITINNSTGQLLQTETITAENDRSTISRDLSEQAAGAYSVVESYPAETETVTWYSDADLLQSGVFGVVEIMIDSGFYASPPTFTISFNAKQETLKYYVVVSNYTANDFDQLSIADTGFAEEGRPRINFTRVPSDAFTSNDIPVGMLAKPGDKVVLFTSQGGVARREKARKNIQLSKNGDILIKHLPQVGQDRASGDVVIHISKP